MSLLVILILLPLVAATVMLLLDAEATPVRARWSALLATIATFLVSLVLASQYTQLPQIEAAHHASPINPKMELRHEWLTLAPSTPGGTPTKFEFYLGVDGISVAMILLTTLLCISAVLVSWTAVTERAAEFYAALLILEAGLLGVFCSFDVLLFYVFFEFTLIPLFFLVGIWGGPLRKYAAGKFFVYTLGGSLITLLGLISLVLVVHQQTNLVTPFSIPDLARAVLDHDHRIPIEMQVTLFLMIAAGFMVKVPLFPFHTWLPLAHVEAPTAGSVLLAGVLLKLGSYGFLRLVLPMLPEACATVGMPLIATLSVIGIIYGSLCALSQNDIKKLVAYSSVAHLGFCMLGLFALNAEGITGGVLQMINHGLSTGALFCLVGMFYERYHTRQLSDLGGLATRLPRLGVMMVFIVFASIGLPGLNGFVGEVLALAGMFKVNMLYAALGAIGVVLGAWYLLGVLQKAFFGPVQVPHAHGHHDDDIPDLNAREILTLAPLAAMCLYLGLFPQTLIELIRPDVEGVTYVYRTTALQTAQVAGSETQP
ncbi:MAG TPA: NADH-quinone oxidoreductase subunit M [Planctomycetaceae bacterium]|nr:NADH-quinone oxidoreductase subunit M [Planctomycetaceae bacterium]